MTEFDLISGAPIVVARSSDVSQDDDDDDVITIKQEPAEQVDARNDVTAMETEVGDG